MINLGFKNLIRVVNSSTYVSLFKIVGITKLCDNKKIYHLY
jgi:hypothetical protein